MPNREQVAAEVAEKLGDNFERVSAMVTDHGEHWDLSENDEVAIQAILTALIDASCELEKLNKKLDIARETIPNLREELAKARRELEELRARQNGWIDVKERLPSCSRKPDSFGVEVAIWPRIDDLATAFYGRRITNSPNFYRHGAVLEGITHWMPMPAAPGADAEVRERK